MSVSIRTRFEVFKRDRFTCHYCGRTPPQVLLEVDHVVPVVAGGSDDAENLITACQDCNRGKSGNLLQEGTAPTVSPAAIEELQQRIEQAQAYAALMQTARRLAQNQLAEVNRAWAEAFDATTEEHDGKAVWTLTGYQRFPKEASVRSILRRLPLEQVLEAVDIAADWGNGYASDRTCRYFYGVCWRRIREREGRDV